MDGQHQTTTIHETRTSSTNLLSPRELQRGFGPTVRVLSQKAEKRCLLRRSTPSFKREKQGEKMRSSFAPPLAAAAAKSQAKRAANVVARGMMTRTIDRLCAAN